MTSREKEVLAKIVALLKKRVKPQKIILFGSRAKGVSERTSDFDLAVDVKKPGVKEALALEAGLDEVAGLYGVDLTYLPEVERDFYKVIMETGKVLYEKRYKARH